jgi:hypothetical protein
MLSPKTHPYTSNKGTVLYTVYDRETGEVCAFDLTLSQAVAVRDHLMTPGDPAIRIQP